MSLIIGGGFQDAEGNPLAGGSLKMQLSSDATYNQYYICAGFVFETELDSSGNVLVPCNVWPNNAIIGVWSGQADTYYMASAFTADGQLAWGPNAVTVSNASPPYDITVWTALVPA